MSRRIFFFTALLAGLAVIITSVLITAAGYNDFFNAVKREVMAETSYIRSGVEAAGEAYTEGIIHQPGHRLTLIAPDGAVLFDSVSDSKTMDNHLNRPEVRAALETGTGEATRYSSTQRERTYYYAVRLESGTVLRMAVTTASVYAAYDDVFWVVALIAVLVFVFAAVIASFVTRAIVRPINAIDLNFPESGVVYGEIVPLLKRIKTQREELDEYVRELDRDRRQFTAITEHMNEGFLVLDGDGRVLSYNKSAMRLLGEKQAAPDGVNVLALNRSEPFREAVSSALGGAANEQTITLGGKICQLYANPVTAEGEVAGAVLLLMDVTEKQEREKLRREFTANVSHELKTPLTAISGYAEILAGGGTKPEDVKEFSGCIYKEAQRLIALVKDIMFLSRLEENPPGTKQTVDLWELSKIVAGRLASRAEKSGVKLTVTGETAEITGFPTALEEIIYNLTDNAIKYNKPGGAAEISVAKTPDGAVLTVSDTGIGIPKAERERIFERFYRVDKSRNEAIDGTGLGLAIVKHAAALHGARVEVESGDKGSRFVVTINNEQ